MDGDSAIDKAIASMTSPVIKRGLREAKADREMWRDGQPLPPSVQIRMWAMEQAIYLFAAQPEEMRGFVLGDFADQLVEYVTPDRDA